jgi:hypothetical protein
MELNMYALINALIVSEWRFGPINLAYEFALIFKCVCILFHVFTFLGPCCIVRYDFRIKTMFSSSLQPFVFVGVHVLFMLLVGINWCSA